MHALIQRARGRWRRSASRWFERRPFTMRNERPIISFTFDDFPRSALHTAGACLEEERVAGTYYTSLGLMGGTAPTGEMFHRDDLFLLLERGHELGCHTHDHRHSFDTPAHEFEESIRRNAKEFECLDASLLIRSLAYPISEPSPVIKKCCSRHFLACRAGGQTYNHGCIDLNAMRGFFLEKVGDDLDSVKKMIDASVQAGGWLILATHDVCDDPTPYGCRTTFFQHVLHCAVSSGAMLLPVSQALREIGVRG